MEECGICYERKILRFLPCNHTVCNDCYGNLRGDNCPYCRHPFRESSHVNPNQTDPDYWLDYDNREWVTYSRFTRSGNEVIRVFRRENVPTSWRNDTMTTEVKRRRLRRKRLRNNNRR